MAEFPLGAPPPCHRIRLRESSAIRLPPHVGFVLLGSVLPTRFVPPIGFVLLGFVLPTGSAPPIGFVLLGFVLLGRLASFCSALRCTRASRAPSRPARACMHCPLPLLCSLFVLARGPPPRQGKTRDFLTIRPQHAAVGGVASSPGKETEPVRPPVREPPAMLPPAMMSVVTGVLLRIRHRIERQGAVRALRLRWCRRCRRGCGRRRGSRSRVMGDPPLGVERLLGTPVHHQERADRPGQDQEKRAKHDGRRDTEIPLPHPHHIDLAVVRGRHRASFGGIDGANSSIGENAGFVRRVPRLPGRMQTNCGQVGCDAERFTACRIGCPFFGSPADRIPRT